MDSISDPQSLDKDMVAFKSALKGYDFAAGERYSEFKAGPLLRPDRAVFVLRWGDHHVHPGNVGATLRRFADISEIGRAHV